MIVIYGSTTGNCEDAAQKIAAQLDIEIIEVSSVTPEELQKHDTFIVGVSTWGLGEMQEDAISFVDILSEQTLDGKKFALFGTGDSVNFSDTFVDAIGELFEVITASGGKVIGNVPGSLYSCDGSRALIDGEYIGLPLDYDNDGGGIDTKINSWVLHIKENL